MADPIDRAPPADPPEAPAPVPPQTLQGLDDARRDALLLAHVRDSVIVTDLNGVVTFWNEGATRLFGWTAGEMIGRPLAGRYPEAQRPAVDAWLARLAAGDVFDGEWEDSRKDGTRIWIHAHTELLRDPAGQPLGIMGVSHEVTARRLAEERLKESQQRLSLAQRAGGVGTFEWHIPENRVAWSPELERLYGIAEGSFEGTFEGWQRRVEFEDAGRVLAGIEACLKDRRTDFSYEFRAILPDGTRRWFAGQAQFSYDEAGRPLRMLGVNVDVHERRRAEEALRESEERLRFGLVAGNTGTWDWDIPRDRVTWSEQIYKFHALKHGEFGGRVADFAPLIHPDDRQRVTDAIRDALENRAPYHTEYRTVLPSGEVRWILTTGEVVFGPGGEPLRMVGAASDVTNHKRAEEQLLLAKAESERKAREAEEGQRTLDALLQNVPEGIIITGGPPDFPIQRISRHGLEMTNRPAATLSALPSGQHQAAWGLFLPDGVTRPTPEQMPLYRATRLGEVVRHVELVMQTGDGRKVPVIVNAAPVRDAAGNIVAGINCWRDITPLKEVEERLREAKEAAEAANKAKDEFIAVLSHELRTPLTPVLLTVSLMESHPGLPEDLREDVAAIRRNIELESRLISDLLDLTRIARGKMQLDFQQVDAHLLIRAAIDICQREKSARLATDLRARHHHVTGDSARLQQVFWNLINNAQKFTDAEGTITVRTSDAPGGRVRIEVSDTGVGIDPAVVPKLFNAFEQGDLRASRQFGGLGLGLAISKKLADLHGGSISASSAGPGRGATFTVELPTARLAAPARAGPAPPADRAAGGRALRILVVEDHEPTLTVLKKLLQKSGHAVATATSLVTARAAANAGEFDLILSDLGLPDGSGLDLARELPPRYAGRSIALTGYGMEEDVRNSAAAGFAAHLTKPIDRQKLEETIGQLVNPAPASGRP